MVNNIFIYFYLFKNNSRGGFEVECGLLERKKMIWVLIYSLIDYLVFLSVW